MTDFNFTKKIFTFYLLSFGHTTILCLDVSRCFFAAVGLVFFAVAVAVVAVFRFVLFLYFSKNRLKDQAS